MEIRVIFDQYVDVLRVMSGQPVNDTASLARGPDAAVDLGTEDGYDVVGFQVIGASAIIPFGQGYNAEADILTIGSTCDDPDLISENGEFVGYWESPGPGEVHDPIGVSLCNASKHLALVLASRAG